MLAVRLAPIKQQDNLVPEYGSKMETTTTNKEAYKGARVTPAAPIKPKHSRLGNIEAFSGSTENRDSFTPKAIEHVQAYRLKDNNIMSGNFSGSSGYNDNFVNRGVVKTKSFAPSYQYRKPSAKFSFETTNKNDFVAYQDVRRQPYTNRNKHDHWQEVQMIPNVPIATMSESTYKHDFPTANGVEARVHYRPPISTLKLGKENVELSTNYKDDFTFRESSKPKSYAPLPTFIKPGVKMDTSTESQDRFKGVFQLPPQSCRPKYELDPYRPPMDTRTNYYESYKKFQFVSDQKPAIPQSAALPNISASKEPNQPPQQSNNAQ